LKPLTEETRTQLLDKLTRISEPDGMSRALAGIRSRLDTLASIIVNTNYQWLTRHFRESSRVSWEPAEMNWYSTLLAIGVV
jgi:hypothetical protein